MSYHGLLDWRLGLSLLRCLADSEFSVGLRRAEELELPDLRGWLAKAESLRDDFCRAFPPEPIQTGQLPGCRIRERSIIVVHPMWDTQRPVGLLAAAIAEAGGAENVHFLDTFNLQRRMSWAYRTLGEQLG